MNTKGFKEYQRIKGIPKDQRTKGPKNTKAGNRKEKEALNPKSRLRPKKKKDWVFLFVALPQKIRIEKKVSKGPEIVLFGHA